MPHKRELAACSLWIAALSLLAFGTMTTERIGTPSPFLAWGLFVALIAVVPTGWVLVEREIEEHEVDIEAMAKVMDALGDARESVRHLH
jgi:uncharacterized membrane protein